MSTGPEPFRRHRALRDRGHGVTSLVDLGLPVTMADLDVALKRSFGEVFGG
jgi:lipoate-protein ligase B